MEYINRFYWLIALCLIISTGANASVNPKPFVIPELKEWKGSDGTFVPTEATKIVYAPTIRSLNASHESLPKTIKQCSDVRSK